MIPENYLKLVKLLIDRTNQDKIDWKETSDNKLFMASLKDFSIGIYKFGTYIRFIIFSKDGKQIKLRY